MSNRETFHLSDFAKILLIIAVLATAGATHLYENWSVSRIGNVTANEMTDTLEWLESSSAAVKRPPASMAGGQSANQLDRRAENQLIPPEDELSWPKLATRRPVTFFDVSSPSIFFGSKIGEFSHRLLKK